MLVINGKESVKHDSVDYTGTLTYLDAGGKQTIKEITNTTRKLVKGIFVDCNVLTQNGTIGFEVKVDGTNYRNVANKAFTVATDDSVWFEVNCGVTEDFKFTYTEGADEGADRALPYMLYLEEKE